MTRHPPRSSRRKKSNGPRRTAGEPKAPGPAKNTIATGPTFEGYCRERSLVALPAELQTVARYLAALARRLKIATIRRRAISISQRHQQHGLETPTAHKLVRDVMAGIANAHGSAPQKKTALTLDLLRLALFGVAGSDLKIARDRAILLLGFAGALRRVELAALDVEDLATRREAYLPYPHIQNGDELGFLEGYLRTSLRETPGTFSGFDHVMMDGSSKTVDAFENSKGAGGAASPPKHRIPIEIATLLDNLAQARPAGWIIASLALLNLIPRHQRALARTLAKIAAGSAFHGVTVKGPDGIMVAHLRLDDPRPRRGCR